MFEEKRMNRLDHQMQKATVFNIINDLGAMKSPRNRRTPSDITSKIVLFCAEMRKKDGALESSIYNVEENMWMVNECHEALVKLAVDAHMIEVIA
jgi:hypothetical protein